MNKNKMIKLDFMNKISKIDKLITNKIKINLKLVRKNIKRLLNKIEQD